MAPFIQAIPVPVHLVTLVNKKDFWFGHETQVHSFYEHGEYSKYITQLQQDRGRLITTPRFRCVALLQEHLRDDKGNVITGDKGNVVFYSTHRLNRYDIESERDLVLAELVVVANGSRVDKEVLKSLLNKNPKGKLAKFMSGLLDAVDRR